MTTKARTTTAVRFSEPLHERLKQAAEDRGLSVNFLVAAAVEDYLDRLVPPEEIARALTRTR